MKKVFRFVWKFIKWTIISTFSVLLLLAMIIHLPPVQSYLLERATDFFNKKTGGKLSIQAVDIRIPYYIQIEGLDLKEPNGEQVASAGNIEVRLGWRNLLSRTISLDEIYLKNVSGKLETDETGSWNYEFIVDGFAREPDVDIDTLDNKKSWDFTTSNIRLNNIDFDYTDGIAGDSLRVNIGQFQTNFQRVSLNNLTFLADKLELANSYIYYSHQPSDSLISNAEINSTRAEEMPLISARTLRINKVESHIKIKQTGSFDVDIGYFEGKIKKLNLEEQVFKVESLFLEETKTKISLAERKESTSDSGFFLDMDISLQELKADRNEVQLDMEGDSLSHYLSLDKIIISEVIIDSSQYDLNLDEISLKYNDYPQIHNLQSDVFLSNQSLKLKDFQLNLGNSKVQLEADFNFPELARAIDKKKLDNSTLDFIQIHLDQNDLNYLKGKLLESDSLPNFESDIDLRGLLSVENNAVKLEGFNLEYGNTLVELDGSKSNLIPTDYAGNISRFHFRLGEPLQSQIIESLNTDNFTIPPNSELWAIANNSSDSLIANIELLNEAGHLLVSIESNISDSTLVPLKTELKADGYHIDKYLPSSENLFAKFQIELESENILVSDSNLALSFQLDTVFYEFGLRNISGNISSKQNNYICNIAIRDTFVNADIAGNIDNNEVLKADFAVHLEGIDLQELKVTENDVRGKADLFATYYQDDESQRGVAELTNIVIKEEKELYNLKNSRTRFYIDSDTTDIDTEGIINGYSRSNRPINEILNQLPSIFNQTVKSKEDTSAVWFAKIDVGELPIIREVFIPELKEFSGLTGELEFFGNKDRINADLKIDRLVYQDAFIDSLRIQTLDQINNSSRVLEIKRLGYDTLGVRNLKISSSGDDELSDINLTIQNNKSIPPDYEIHATLGVDSVKNNLYHLLLGDSLIINNEVWITEENEFQFSDSISFGNFLMKNSERSIEIRKKSNSDGYDIGASKFDLAALLGVFENGDIAKGLISGKAHLSSDSLYSDGNIQDLKLFGAMVGDIQWDVRRNGGFIFNLSSKEGDLIFDINGKSIPGNKENEIDFKANLDRLNLSLLASLFPDKVFDANGFLNGNMSLNGKANSPSFNGKFTFNQGSIKSIYNKSIMRIQSDEIRLSNDEIDLGKITLIDSSGNKLNLSGKIHDFNSGQAKMDLAINSSEFELMNASPEDGGLVYGRLISDLDIKITDRLIAPKIRAKVKITKGTDFTYKVPTARTYETFDDNLIVWKTLDSTSNVESILTREKEKLNNRVDIFAGTVDFNGNLEITKDAKLKVLIDSAAGDFLEAKGDARISMNYDRAGNLRMTGNYYVSEGFYQMNFYNLSKKKFTLDQGGYINWNGDAFNPNLNLSARYTTRANLANLMMTESSSTVNPAYQQSLPFNVVMKINGEVESPEILFDIQLDEENQGALNGAVDSRLNVIKRDESELNKQVFSLLVLNMFVPSGSNNNPNLIENQARNSASQILSDQLNKYGDEYVKGVDLNFDLQSYGGVQGTGNTDLTVDVAKSFFDNRVVVRVGSTIALENNIYTADNNQFNTNFVLEYLITEDGRYRFLGYSKTNLEDIVVGRITRTGAGLVYQRDFDRFKYLLQPKSRPDNVNDSKE